jgi:ectoine hydroxylase-related dioxygenase (phytanoyl-CoA dioxygenase family)
VPVTPSQFDSYQRNGWLLCRPFAGREIQELQQWVTEVQNWDDSGDWLHYREMTDNGPKLCRTENFVPFHPKLHDAIATGIILDIVSALMGEKASLYKEKINYKLVGGAGFSPHQDAPAYPFVETSISCMIAIDASTVENGCLSVVDGEHHALLPMNDRGCIIDEWVQDHEWHHVEMEPGDVLFFHSHTPHRSGSNTSQRDRRAIYPTFNAASQGNLRDAYYEEKLRVFRDTAHTANNVRISLIDDFEGLPL